MNLLSQTIETSLLCGNDVGSMYNLMEQYFDGLNRKKFQTDLIDKKWVIVLREPRTAEIRGFSTITLMETEVEGRKIKAFYSGDTIVDKNCRRPFSLEVEWTPLVFSYVLSEPETFWYWFMVCKGYRTYRYFPVHFHQFWPSPDSPIPSFEKKVLDNLSKARFGRYYDPGTFVITYPSDYRLKPGVGDISPEKSKNRYVRFFDTTNSGWAKGDELACITPLRLDNIKSSIKRFLPASGIL